MHSTVLVCLSLIAISAAAFTGNRQIYVFEEGNNYILVNQDGRTVQIFMEKVEGQKGMKSIRIQVAGPNVTTKVVTFNDEQVKKTEKSEEKYQTDIIREILKQYHGAVEMTTFEQLVNSMEKHMKLGVLNSNYFYAFEFVMTPNVEMIEAKNPLVQLNKHYEMTTGQNTQYKNDNMYPENRMGNYHNMQGKDIYNKMLMQKYAENMYGMNNENEYEKEAMVKALLEKEMEDKYNSYKRMMMEDRNIPEYTRMGQDYETQYYMKPENWYTGKYGMTSQYGMANKYGMNKYGMDYTYGDDDMPSNTMVHRVIYGNPETRELTPSQRYMWTTPVEYTTMKRHMYENQYPDEQTNVMTGYRMTHEPMTYNMNMKHSGTKNLNDDQMMMREKMMMMRPSMMMKKNYQGQMHMDESPIVDRYTTSRKDYSNIVY